MTMMFISQFTLATSDSRVGKYKTVEEQLTQKHKYIYTADDDDDNAIVIEKDYVGMVQWYCIVLHHRVLFLYL